MHWPFCASKCPYCDFNSHVRAGGIDEARFRAAFLRELLEEVEGSVALGPQVFDLEDARERKQRSGTADLP